MDEFRSANELTVCPLCKGMGARSLVTAGEELKVEVCRCQHIARIDPKVCLLCDGMGMRLATTKGTVRAMEACECQHERKVQRLLQRAAIPTRYEQCSFENFEYDRLSNEVAYNVGLAKTFTELFPAGKEGVGLLFTGTVGTGKTHLATAVLRKLVLEKGVHGLFCDYQELLKQITNSYNATVKITEFEVLRPIFEAEVLLLDELGAYRTTDWVFDTVSHILNTRYNKKRTTIITTNYAVDLPVETKREGRLAEPINVMRQEMLVDRIGERMHSRLKQTCIPIKMIGPDYRNKDRATLQ